MKKIIGFIFIALLLLGLALNLFVGEDFNELQDASFKEPEALHVSNFLYAVYYEKKNSVVKVFSYVGQRDINYHFKSGTKVMALQQSGGANFAYNFSYLVNTPAKFLHNTIFLFEGINQDGSLFPSFEQNTVSIQEQEGTFMVDDVLLNKEGEPINLEDIETFTSEKKVTKTVINWSAWAMFISAFLINLADAFFGAIFACVMLVVGTITGTLFHPILTIKELLPALWASVLSVFIAVKNIFFW